MFFHGSKNENWFSIIMNSLLLPQHNYASKTGQSLGNRLYFANCSIKSSHYSSLDEYILGVFDVGLKNPYQIIDDGHNAYKLFTRKQLLIDGYDGVHYHRKHVKWADEIVAFTERSVCLKVVIFIKVK